jgi:hypothetical protein
MDWPRILAYITGTVDQELLVLRNYSIGEYRITSVRQSTVPRNYSRCIKFS